MCPLPDDIPRECRPQRPPCATHADCIRPTYRQCTIGDIRSHPAASYRHQDTSQRKVPLKRGSQRSPVTSTGPARLQLFLTYTPPISCAHNARLRAVHAPSTARARTHVLDMRIHAPLVTPRLQRLPATACRASSARIGLARTDSCQRSLNRCRPATASHPTTPSTWTCIHTASTHAPMSRQCQQAAHSARQ